MIGLAAKNGRLLGRAGRLRAVPPEDRWLRSGRAEFPAPETPLRVKCDLARLAVAVITAPRPVPTLEKTFRSLRRAGFAHSIYIGAEPGAVSADGMWPDVQVARNPGKLGCFPNWLAVARRLLDSTDAPYLLICEDDVELADCALPGLFHAMETLDRVGYVSLYTPVHNAALADMPRTTGWHALTLGSATWGALAYCFPRDVLREVVARAGQDPPPDGTDQHVSRIVADLRLNAWFHAPSLAKHIGETSSLGHRQKPGFEAVGYDRLWPGYRDEDGLLEVVHLTPNLLIGGVEHWFLALAKYSDPKKVRWWAGLTDPSAQDSSIAARVRELMPLAVGFEPIRRLIRGADAVVAWGIPHLAEYLDGFAGPVILVAHGCGHWTENWIRQARAVATHYVAVSKPAANSFGTGDVTVIHGGVDPDRCRPRQPRRVTRAAWGLADSEILVGFVGRISPEKNCEAIAAAVELLGPPFRAVFIGPTYDPAYADTVRASGPSALFAPPVEHVGDALAALDCLVLASPAEGGPLIVLEAMYAGLPVVSTPVGLLPSLVHTHGQLFVPIPIEATPEQVALAIRQASSLSWRPVASSAASVIGDDYLARHAAEAWANYLQQCATHGRPLAATRSVQNVAL